MTDWEEDCLEWRGSVLTGKHAHWCPEWDDLPIDETCAEWPCGCAESEEEHPGEGVVNKMALFTLFAK
jgi:hypothetical protein